MMLLIVSFLQLLFQVVLVTDMTSSFAIFIYDDLSTVQRLSIPVQVGFNAGDQQRYLNIPVNYLQQVNVYRIDGTYVCKTLQIDLLIF